ncbi:MAG TPA: NAD(P)/FAD-dependent oxidoreductase [Kineosporiaceae bacterium]|nr:NAD(P)/FAD-dependent oxidoreductase [Kineosporiaceae bacterium]
MPRTPLARALARMAAAHRAADPAVPSPSGPSRRGLLAGAGAVAGAAAVGELPGAARPARAATAARVVVVGAGISGLAAALRLQDSGVPSTVYEANTRVGGRMYSNTSTWAGGQVSEWGGELVDTNHKTIQALAKRFGIALDDLVQAEPSGSEPTYVFEGAYYSYAQATKDFQVVHQAVTADRQTFTWPVTWNSSNDAGKALSKLSVHDWIETRVPGGHTSPMGQLLDVAYTIEYGGDTKDQTSLGLLGLLGYQPSPGQFSIFGLSDERYHLRGGNDQLPRAIAAALPAGSVLTGWKLTKLVTNADGTQTLTFATAKGTRTVTADHTVLAVPLGVLKTLDVSAAGFDSRKQGSIAAMRMGANVKLQLQFTRRLWNGKGAWPGVSTGESYSDSGYQNTWDVTRAQGGAQGILVDYTGGPAAAGFDAGTPFADQSNSKVTAYAKAFLGQLETVYPGITALWNGRATLSAWPRNPYSLGAYSYWPTDYCQTYAGYEGVRQGNTHFAGEHCSIDFQGYMEGGAVEGQRAAQEVLADLGVK